MTISNKEAKQLRDHSKKHTDAHMREMRSEMRKSRSFNMAHKTALRKVGK